MITEEQLNLLVTQGILTTDFSTIPINAHAILGKPLGIGGRNERNLRAVILRHNYYDSETGLASPYTHFYYGDARQVQKECISGIESAIIFCQDLNEVFVRFPLIFASILVAGAGTADANGIYTFRYIENNRPVYINGNGYILSIVVDDGLWYITNTENTQLYRALETALYPYLVEGWYDVIGNAPPVPTVTAIYNDIDLIQIQKYKGDFDLIDL